MGNADELTRQIADYVCIAILVFIVLKIFIWVRKYNEKQQLKRLNTPHMIDDIVFSLLQTIAFAEITVNMSHYDIYKADGGVRYVVLRKVDRLKLLKLEDYNKYRDFYFCVLDDKGLLVSRNEGTVYYKDKAEAESLFRYAYDAYYNNSADWLEYQTLVHNIADTKNKKESVEDFDLFEGYNGDNPISDDFITSYTPVEFFEYKRTVSGDAVGVYIIYNIDKDKFYVGQAKRLLYRINQHFTGHGNPDVYVDYRQGDSFRIAMIKLIDSGYEDLDKLEKDKIREYHAYEQGYNKTKGNG